RICSISSLLENNEWAEHCTSTVLGSLLESEITRLVSKEQPVPVVPEEAYSDDCPDLYASQPEAWAAGWNSCRAAMLNGGKS
ncbi:hypothetical protein FYU45_26485, partial [Salmonella enterica subsp. diarizonae]|nr:hypothetical protein [Salmonella enterica subsp. diarizonae]